MKKYLLYTMLVSLTLLASCSKELETTPTDKTTSDVVFSTGSGAYAAINGIYRYMYMTGYTPSWGAENFGYSSILHCYDMVGEDMAKRDPGSQWFFYDHLFWVRGEITSTSDRPIGWWTFFYKIIMSSNNIIAYVPNAVASEQLKNNVIGQALALRAFAYYNLVNIYQLTYDGNLNAKGVPIYTEPSDKNTIGKGRGTVEQVYNQINTDLDLAIEKLKNAEAQKNKSNIDLYAAYGLKARVALMMHDWITAKAMAKKALEKPGLALMSSTELTGGFNAINNEWLWGAQVLDAQATGVSSFMSHMDAAEGGGYAKNSGVLVSRWMYDLMSNNDIRKQKWFTAPTMDWRSVTQDQMDEMGVGTRQVYLKYWESQQNDLNSQNSSQGFPYSSNSYMQLKFRMKGPGNWANDLIYMRAAEMYLIIAEASCMRGEYGDARTALNTLMASRVPGYDASIFPNGNVQTVRSYVDDATYAARNLLDEVLMQRRIELWGEGFRLFDLTRQKIAIDRQFPETNFLSILGEENGKAIPDYGTCAVKHSYAADKWAYVMMLPMKEFTSNPNFTPADQNPAW
jgi:hypothetical protein